MRCTALLLLILVLLDACLAADYYKVLGLNKDASEKQIKTAFRKLSLKYHPDKNPDNPDAEKKFVEVSEAYQILSDPEKRELYDKHGENAFKPHGGGGPGPGFQGFSGGFPGGGGGGFGFEDPFSFFNTMFGKGGGGGGGGQQGMKFSFGGGGGGQQQGGRPRQGGFPGGGFPGGGHHGGGGGGHHGGGGAKKGSSTQLYEYSEDIQYLNQKKLNELVKTGEGIWLVQFYSSSDTEFVDTYVKIAKGLKHFVNVAAINMEKEKTMSIDYHIEQQSTPLLMIFPFGSRGDPKKAIKYTEELDYQSVVNFALSHIPDFTHKITGVSDAIFQDQTLPKVLLFSAKDTATPLYKAIARDMRTKFKFGLVPQKAKHVLENFQIKNVPTLIVVEVDGSIKPYKGEFNYAALSKFLQGLSGKQSTTPPKAVPTHRKTDGDIHQLTQANIDTQCGDDICIVLFTADQTTKDYAVAKELASKYRKDGFAFVWVKSDSDFRQKLVDVSKKMPSCVTKDGESGECVMVAIRGVKEKGKFAWLPASTPLQAGDVGLFLDRVIGGDVQWTRETIPRDAL